MEQRVGRLELVRETAEDTPTQERGDKEAKSVLWYNVSSVMQKRRRKRTKKTRPQSCPMTI